MITTLEKPKNNIQTVTSNHKTLGKKHTCYNCSTKFYDLGKPSKVCPKCGSDQNAKPIIKHNRITKTMFKTSEFDVIDEAKNSDDDAIFLDEEELEIDEERSFTR